MRKHISPATAISLVALFFSLTGASLAASHFIITSTRQIAPSVRRALKGAAGAAGAQGAPGTAGAQGAVGVAGAQGTSGVAGSFSSATTTLVNGPNVAMCAAGDSCDVVATVAYCPAGTTVITGGMADNAEQDAPGPGLTVSNDATLTYDQPFGDGWEIIMTNHGSAPVGFRAVALCAS